MKHKKGDGSKRTTQLSLEDRVYRALSQRGWTIPVSEEQVERAEKLLSQELAPSSGSGLDPLSILDRGEVPVRCRAFPLARCVEDVE